MNNRMSKHFNEVYGVSDTPKEDPLSKFFESMDADDIPGVEDIENMDIEEAVADVNNAIFGYGNKIAEYHRSNEDAGVFTILSAGDSGPTLFKVDLRGITSDEDISGELDLVIAASIAKFCIKHHQVPAAIGWNMEGQYGTVLATGYSKGSHAEEWEPQPDVRPNGAELVSRMTFGIINAYMCRDKQGVDAVEAAPELAFLGEIYKDVRGRHKDD